LANKACCFWCTYIFYITIEKQHIQTVSTVISLNSTSVNCWYGYVLNYIWRYNINLRGFSKTNCYLLLFWQIEYANVHVFGRRANVTMLLKFTFKKHQNQRKLVCMPICYTKRLYVFFGTCMGRQQSTHWHIFHLNSFSLILLLGFALKIKGTKLAWSTTKVIQSIPMGLKKVGL